MKRKVKLAVISQVKNPTKNILNYKGTTEVFFMLFYYKMARSSLQIQDFFIECNL